MDEVVAIKSIKVTESPEAANGLDHTALREIRLMQELNHDNICKVSSVAAYCMS
jgi:cyclin-dependent kinase 7